MRKDKRLEDFDELLAFAEKKMLSKSQRVLKRIQVNIFSRRTEKNLTHLLTLLILKSNLKSIQIIKTLTRKNHIDEVMVLIRVMIERCALSLYGLENKLEVAAIEKLDGSKCISHLKRKFIHVGRLYGYFSKIAHSKPVPSIHFWVLNIKDSIKTNNKEKIKELEVLLRCLLFFATEINFSIITFLAKECLNLKSYWQLDKDNSWSYNPPRTGGPILVSDYLFYLCHYYFGT